MLTYVSYMENRIDLLQCTTDRSYALKMWNSQEKQTQSNYTFAHAWLKWLMGMQEHLNVT